MKIGLERLLASDDLKKKYSCGRIGVLCHAASVDAELRHIIDLIVQRTSLEVSCAFGPQHGLRAEKQDNMIESSHFIHPKYKFPIFSLYGEVRRPTSEMMEAFDILIVDMQDVGCRIYTFLTTLFYCLEACAEFEKKIVVLDRPNPAGRPVEGNRLDMDWHSFVGAAPIPMRHGLTLGEAALWYKDHKKLIVDLDVVEMEGYKPGKDLDSVWPRERTWVNPSPNIPRLTCTQMYSGTVLLEGTRLSEGRGTTLPLEMFGAPGLDAVEILLKMKDIYPDVNKSCILRPCHFEPTFHKHQNHLCEGLQIHVDHPKYKLEEFKPYRLICAFLKAVQITQKNKSLWRDPPYEYETEKMPIDILSGGEDLRNWVDSNDSDFSRMEYLFSKAEKSWLKERTPFLLYS